MAQSALSEVLSRVGSVCVSTAGGGAQGAVNHCDGRVPSPTTRLGRQSKKKMVKRGHGREKKGDPLPPTLQNYKSDISFGTSSLPYKMPSIFLQQRSKEILPNTLDHLQDEQKDILPQRLVPTILEICQWLGLADVLCNRLGTMHNVGWFEICGVPEI